MFPESCHKVQPCSLRKCWTQIMFFLSEIRIVKIMVFYGAMFPESCDPEDTTLKLNTTRRFENVTLFKKFQKKKMI